MLAAVDPGTDKFGWAICDDNGGLLISGISSLSDLEDWASELLGSEFYMLAERASEKFGMPAVSSVPEFVLVGTGTGSRPLIERLMVSGLKVKTVREEFSSIRGRELFWKIHPPGRLLRFLPLTLLVPGRSIDDLAAWSLILDHIGKDTDKDGLPECVRRE